MDLRASGIQKFGIQQGVPKLLEKKRVTDAIYLEETRGKDPDSRLPAYKRKYTPITQYMKRL